MKRLLVCAALAGCAAQAPVTDAPVAVLDGKPQRTYEVIERIEARGVPGAHVRPGARGARGQGARAAGSDVRSRGPYYLLEGLAIRYTD